MLAIAASLKTTADEAMLTSGTPVQDIHLVEQRVRELALEEPLETYAACARRFERENLMLMAVTGMGSGNSLGGEDLLAAWTSAGLLTKDEADVLSQKLGLQD